MSHAPAATAPKSAPAAPKSLAQRLGAFLVSLPSWAPTIALIVYTTIQMGFRLNPDLAAIMFSVVLNYALIRWMPLSGAKEIKCPPKATAFGRLTNAVWLILLWSPAIALWAFMFWTEAPLHSPGRMTGANLFLSNMGTVGGMYGWLFVNSLFVKFWQYVRMGWHARKNKNH